MERFDPASSIFSSPRPPLCIPPHLHILSFLFSTTTDPTFHHLTALTDTASSESLTFLALRRRIQTTARALSFLGIRQHDVVLIVSPNSIHFPVAFFAIVSLGAIATCANPANTPREILKQAAHSHAKLIITVPELAHAFQDSGLQILLITDSSTLPRPPSAPETYSHSHVKRLSDIIKQSAQHTLPSVNIQQTDTAALMYTSGTTGVSKGAVLSHRNFIVVALQVQLAADTHKEAAGRSAFLCCVPMFHGFGLSVTVLAQLHMGNTIISMARYSIEGMLAAIETYQVTHLPVVPPILVALAKYEAIQNYNLSSVVEVSCGAGRVNPETMEEVCRRLPNAVIRLDYGMTEVSGRIAVTSCDRTQRHPAGSAVGALVSGTEAVVVEPDSNKRLPPNKRGELWIRGPNIMQGYLNDQEATASTIDKDGWLHTGDIVLFDNEGNVHVVGRLKELIKYKGFQVAPVELETLLMTHSEIIDAAVVPFPDNYAGEIPMAFVVRAPESSLTEQDVIKFVEAQVAPYKKIRKVKFVEKLPKTASGKVVRHKLMQQAISKL